MHDLYRPREHCQYLFISVNARESNPKPETFARCSFAGKTNSLIRVIFSLRKISTLLERIFTQVWSFSVAFVISC